jgi:hypothetical protein
MAARASRGREATGKGVTDREACGSAVGRTDEETILACVAKLRPLVSDRPANGRPADAEAQAAMSITWTD